MGQNIGSGFFFVHNAMSSSSLTRGIFFSAMATATGFGSLWASRHPGTASMGKLLMISLIWTLVSALLFQPALMGPPPKDSVPKNSALKASSSRH